jgi:hypothetical protein
MLIRKAQNTQMYLRTQSKAWFTTVKELAKKHQTNPSCDGVLLQTIFIFGLDDS